MAVVLNYTNPIGRMPREEEYPFAYGYPGKENGK